MQAAQNAELQKTRYAQQLALNQGAMRIVELEVQASIANAQQVVGLAIVRDTVKTYIDAFLNAWIKANGNLKVR